MQHNGHLAVPLLIQESAAPLRSTYNLGQVVFLVGKGQVFLSTVLRLSANITQCSLVLGNNPDEFCLLTGLEDVAILLLFQCDCLKCAIIALSVVASQPCRYWTLAECWPRRTRAQRISTLSCGHFTTTQM